MFIVQATDFTQLKYRKGEECPQTGQRRSERRQADEISDELDVVAAEEQFVARRAAVVHDLVSMP
jgi:hypothetical protein